MSIKIGQAIAWDNQTTLIQFDSGCETCGGCVNQKPKLLTVSGEFSRDVQLELTTRHQLFGLFNSWLLPILFAVLMALVADWLQFSELYGIILVFCGFTLGIALCRCLSPAALLIEESAVKPIIKI